MVKDEIKDEVKEEVNEVQTEQPVEVAEVVVVPTEAPALSVGCLDSLLGALDGCRTIESIQADCGLPPEVVGGVIGSLMKHGMIAGEGSIVCSNRAVHRLQEQLVAAKSGATGL